MTKVVLIFIISLLTFNIAQSNDYSEFEKGNKKIAKTEKIAKEARRWVIESKQLILEIDIVLREYKELQNQGKEEVNNYIRVLDSLIGREKDLISLVVSDCQKTGDTSCKESYLLKGRLASLIKSRSKAKKSLGEL